MIAGGWPDERTDEWRHQLSLRAHNCCLLADSFFEAGFTPVIDDVVIGARLDEFTSSIRNRPLLFVLLLPSAEIVRERDARRLEKHVFDSWGYLDESARAHTPKVGLWLDSSDLTAEKTADAILQRAWPEAVI